MQKSFLIDMIDPNVKYLHGVKNFAISDIGTLPAEFTNTFSSIAIGGGTTYSTRPSSMGDSLYTSVQVICKGAFTSAVITLEGSNLGGTDADLWESIATATLTSEGAAILLSDKTNWHGRKVHALHRIKIAATGDIDAAYVIGYGHL